jgi:hypothetical protein
VNRIDPRGKEDLVETEGEEEEAPAEEKGLDELSRRINCTLDTISSGLDVLGAIQSGDLFGTGFALTGFAANFENCSAEASGKKKSGPSEPGTCPLCFAAGTPVHTNRGDVPVEQIKVGDEVESRNSQTGTLEKEPVTALIAPHKGILLEMRIEGERTPLRPSLGHPFWVKRGTAEPDWVPADHMRVGDSYNHCKVSGAGWWRSPRSQARKRSTTSPSTKTTTTSSARLASSFTTQAAGNFLKWGISFDASTRYTGPTLDGYGGSPGPNVVDSGTRRNMLSQERELKKRFPGPLNCERGAGSNSMW